MIAEVEAEKESAGNNYCMTGSPYWTTDIGGFFRGVPGPKKDYKDQYTSPNFRELLTRWFQYGTFTPLFRIHGFRTETEIWKFGEEFESIARKFLDLRYQLMPYIYAEAKAVTDEGKILMSPLPYYFADDKATWDVKYQFMFGQSIMVCPVTEYRAREREVYLPKETDWFDFWTGEKIAGGQTITAPSPLNSMPLYVKAGSILPWGPKLQHVEEVTDEPIVLKVYPGQDATYTLYFDDQKSYNYEQGEYTEVVVSYAENDQTVTLETGQDNYLDLSSDPLEFVIELVGSDNEEKLIFDGSKLVKKI